MASSQKHTQSSDLADEVDSNVNNAHAFESVGESFRWMTSEIEKATQGDQIGAMQAAIKVSKVLESTEGFHQHLSPLLARAKLGDEFNGKVEEQNRRIQNLRDSIKGQESQLMQLAKLDETTRELEKEEQRLIDKLEERKRLELLLQERQQELEYRRKIESQKPDIDKARKAVEEDIQKLEHVVRDRDAMIATAKKYSDMARGIGKKVDSEVASSIKQVVQITSELEDLVEKREQATRQIAELEAEREKTLEGAKELEENISVIRESQKRIQELWDENQRKWETHQAINLEIARSLGLSDHSPKVEDVEAALLALGRTLETIDESLRTIFQAAQQEVTERHPQMSL